MSLPSGTLTFLFTDVVGSTRLWERDAPSMRAALAEHDQILTEAVRSHGGVVFKKMGDSVCAVFEDASAAVGAALDAQGELQGSRPDLAASALSVRMALYTGFAQPDEGDYVGPSLNRTARILGTGHGGQVLMCQATRDLAVGYLPDGASLLDLGFHSLKDLARSERIYQLAHPNLPIEFPPLRSLSTFKHNLPIQLTSLIGREQEIVTLQDVLKNHRLVTLYGSGGCGKTRLALQVGAEVVDWFPDGVWLVELGNATDSSQSEEAVASVLGLREEAQRELGQIITRHLRDQRALLILDNCEHLVDSCAKQVQSLLQSCPDVKVLVTSREILSVPGEVAWRVPSLPVPTYPANPVEADEARILRTDSVRLFAERGAVAAPGFTVGAHNMQSVVQIAQRLDGIPLALELAAARVRSLSVEQISERLQDHFSILVGPRTALPRQKTLRATMDWSFMLLDERERAILARLSVFSGGWTLEAAEAVCVPRRRSESDPFTSDDVLDLLSHLEEKSLIGVVRDEDSARYHMLQMVREYVSEHLGPDESTALGRRHLDYFLGIAEESAANIPGPIQAEWLRKLDLELDNIRATLDFAKRDADLGESGLRLAGSMSRYWHIRGFFSEGRRHLTAMISLAAKAGDSAGMAIAKNGLGILAWSQGDLAVARESYEESLRIWRSLDDEHQIAWVLSNLGLVNMDQRNYAEARLHFEQSLELRRRLRDVSGEALSLMNLGILARHEERYGEGQRLYDESLVIFRELGDVGGQAKALNNLGDVLFQQGKTEDAIQMQQESLAFFEQLGDRRGSAFALLNLGDFWWAQQDIQNALSFYTSSAGLARMIGTPFILACSLLGIVRIGFHLGYADNATLILGAARPVRREVSESQDSRYAREWSEVEATSIRLLGPAMSKDYIEKGEHITGEGLGALLMGLNWLERTKESKGTARKAP